MKKSFICIILHVQNKLYKLSFWNSLSLVCNTNIFFPDIFPLVVLSQLLYFYETFFFAEKIYSSTCEGIVCFKKTIKLSNCLDT